VSTDDSGVFSTNPTREILLFAKAFGLNELALGRLMLRSLADVFEPSQEVVKLLNDSVQARMVELLTALGATAHGGMCHARGEDMPTF